MTSADIELMSFFMPSVSLTCLTSSGSVMQVN
jgi:hypothetical protein